MNISQQSNKVSPVMQSYINNRQKVMGVAPEEAFRLLGISRSTGYRMIKNGNIRAVRLGKRLVVPIAVLEDLLGL